MAPQPQAKATVRNLPWAPGPWEEAGPDQNSRAGYLAVCFGEAADLAQESFRILD